MVVFSIILLAALIVINKLYVWKMKYSSSLESGMILSTAFMNSGNYGAPIILFAYGQEGFGYAVSLLVLHAIFMNFFGVYYAARGLVGISTAVIAVLTMPATYAVIIAIIFKMVDVNVVSSVTLITTLLSIVTITILLLIL